MTITVTHGYPANEEQAIEALERDGFNASATDYAPGRSEPHQHDYDVCVHVVSGEFKVIEAAQHIVHSCGPGAKVFVPSGTRHWEDHGAVRLVVGRRN